MTKFTKEFIEKSKSCSAFLEPPADKLYCEALDEISRLQSHIAELEYEVAESNSLLRSAYQIAKREGKATNWEALKGQLDIILKRQHEIVYGKKAGE